MGRVDGPSFDAVLAPRLGRKVRELMLGPLLRSRVLWPWRGRGLFRRPFSQPFLSLLVLPEGPLVLLLGFLQAVP